MRVCDGLWETLGSGERLRGALAASLLLTFPSLAVAQDPETGLADAEARAATARAEIPEHESAVRSAESRLEAAERRAAPAQSRAHNAAARVSAVETALRRKQLHAAAAVGRVEEERSDASDKHDRTVRSGIGFGLASLIMVAIALAWGWFRASAAVAYLARIEPDQVSRRPFLLVSNLRGIAQLSPLSNV
jgi:hypothetical protein